MSHNWADITAERLLGQGLVGTGICLILGGSDTGKTTLAAALSKQAAANRIVALRGTDAADLAIGLIKNWRPEKDLAVVRAPQIDVKQIHCLVIGDISLRITEE
jgi:DNA replication protein DnaC